MKAKNKRHTAILEIIKDSNVETQEDITLRLLNMGIKATQATVSRDIKELHLIKVLDKNTNRYKYEQRTVSMHENPILPSKTVSILRDGIIHMKVACNLVVVKCYAGMAQAVCASLDSAHREEIIGTLAGDDTIFIAAESEENAEKLLKDLTSVISGNS